MREIKFRVWDGTKLHYAPMLHMITGADFEGSCGTGIGKTFSAEQGAILEQYTGLTDKNGKEIYEGDKLRRYGGAIIIVKWSDAEFNIQNGSLYEIIGNIHSEAEK